MDLSGINLDKQTVDSLRLAFNNFHSLMQIRTNNVDRFLPENESNEKKLNVSLMKQYYERVGLDLEQPSMYSMICWIARDTQEAGH